VRPRLQSGIITRPLSFTVRAHMQRPRAVARLSLILMLIGLSALGGIAGIPWGQPGPVAPQLLRLDPIVTSWVLLVVGTVYCAATLLCAFALWRMRPWARVAYSWFIGSITIYLVTFLYLIRVPTPLWLGVAFFALLAVGLYCGWRIVNRTFGAAAKAL
jgi:hypothetical protein